MMTVTQSTDLSLNSSVWMMWDRVRRMCAIKSGSGEMEEYHGAMASRMKRKRRGCSSESTRGEEVNDAGRQAVYVSYREFDCGTGGTCGDIVDCLLLLSRFE